MPPAKFGRYEVIGELGRGGMATVFRARDPAVGRMVAVKVLATAFAQDPGFRARFQREARAVAALEHGAIVPLYDFGEEAGDLYLVLRYLEGGSLADRLTRGPIAPAAAVAVFRRIAAALDYAHANGIVHRDVKPANILFDLPGRGEAYLADFGVARLSEASSLATQAAIGSPSYMSPEQIDGSATAASDIYSLGCTAFESLCGRPPFQAPHAIAVMLRHRNDPVPSAFAVRPELGQAADDVFARAMAKDPAARFGTASAFVTALERALAGVAPEPVVIDPFDRTIFVPPPIGVFPQAHGHVRLQLTPGTQRAPLLRRHASYSLEIENRGQEAVSVSLGGSTFGEECAMELPSSVSVPANGLVRVIVSVGTRKRRLTGRRKVHPFAVRGYVAGTAGEATASAELEDDPTAALRPVALATGGLLVLAASFGSVALLAGRDGGGDDAASPGGVDRTATRQASPSPSPATATPTMTVGGGRPSPTNVPGATATSTRVPAAPTNTSVPPPPPTATTAPPTPRPTATIPPATPSPPPVTPTRTATPAPTPTAAPTTYTVQPGDTCFSISIAFGITQQQLRALNPAINSDCTNLFVGQVLRIR